MKVDRLKSVAKDVYKLLESCEICPRRCKVNRLKGEKGFCKGGLKPTVVSAQPHFGEETRLSGGRGQSLGPTFPPSISSRGRRKDHPAGPDLQFHRHRPY